MALLVKKFGGSSVATPEKMRHIASRVLKERNPDDQIVIVVSAMGDTTDNLLNLASKVTDKHYARELDMLMSTGEQVSIAMMAMTFCSMGVPASLRKVYLVRGTSLISSLHVFSRPLQLARLPS